MTPPLVVVFLFFFYKRKIALNCLKIRWCRWGAEQMVKRTQNQERGPQSVPVKLTYTPKMTETPNMTETPRWPKHPIFSCESSSRCDYVTNSVRSSVHPSGLFSKTNKIGSMVVKRVKAGQVCFNHASCLLHVFFKYASTMFQVFISKHWVCFKYASSMFLLWLKYASSKTTVRIKYALRWL